MHVDRRVELLAILQRLAEAPEYKTAPTTAYVREIDNHFAPFAKHPAVVLTHDLHTRAFSYDAPMLLAINLNDELELVQRPDDARYRSIELESYLASARDFAKKSGFDAFFTAHRAYYEKLEARLRTAITTENPRPWFDAFFGKRATAHFTVVPTPLAGTWNYGPHVGDNYYQMLGIAKVDFDELPVVDGELIELLVHEITHSYVNPIFEKHQSELAASAQRLFARVEPQMRQQAYPTWEIFMNEQGVRAITALYLHDRKGADAGQQAVHREVGRSFLWTEPLAQLLNDKYRGHYRDLEAFMPELVAFLATLQ